MTMCDKLRLLPDAELRGCAAELKRAVAATVLAHRPNPSQYRGLSALYFPAGADRAAQIAGSRIAPSFF